MMIIDHEGLFYTIWKTIHVLSCLSSSFLYGFLSCFSDVDPSLYEIDVMFETIFLISVVVEFLTDFKDSKHS